MNAGEKVTQVMKKTMVEFISIEPRIYLLDLPLVMLDGVLVKSYTAHSRLQVTHCLWPPPPDLVDPHCSALLSFPHPRAREWFI